MIRGNEGKYLQLMRRFLASHQHNAEQLKGYIASYDHNSAMRLMHSLRGAASVLGLVEIAALARSLETTIKNEVAPIVHCDTVDRDIASLKAAMATLVAALPSKESAQSPSIHELAAGQSLLIRLESLLAQHDMAAFTVFDENTAVIKNALGISYSAFERHISTFSFEEALPILRRLLS